LLHAEWGHKERYLGEGSFGCVEWRLLNHDNKLLHSMLDAEWGHKECYLDTVLT
jgi:hypothetical protein